MVATNTSRISTARAGVRNLSQRQKVSFAIELARDITNPDCIVQLNCLARTATVTAEELQTFKAESKARAVKRAIRGYSV